jgi:hypothetical protein
MATVLSRYHLSDLGCRIATSLHNSGQLRVTNGPRCHVCRSSVHAPTPDEIAAARKSAARCQEQTWTLARANRLLRIENLFGDVPLLDCATPLCGSKQPAHRAYRPIRFLVEPQVCHPESCTASAGRLAFIVDPCTEYQQTPSDFKF